jgi:aminoglycoside 6'-N-acetyltransferase I
MAAQVRIVRDDPGFREQWARMRRELWPDATLEQHLVEIDRYFTGERCHLQAVLLAVDASGSALGFAELNIRPYAEGCSTDRVAYLEGWYVATSHRRRGIGGALVAEAALWAREQGCTEFASDVVAGNDVSAMAHRALGFEEVESIICFRKELGPPQSG